MQKSKSGMLRCYATDWQCILHKLVCWLTKKVLSELSQVSYNKKHNFELWYNVGIYLANRQKSKREPVPVRRPAFEKHCSILLPVCS